MENCGTKKSATAESCEDRENFGTQSINDTIANSMRVMFVLIAPLDRYKNGQLKWYAHYTEGSQVHGECRWWHSNGQVTSESFTLHNVLIFLKTYWNNSSCEVRHIIRYPLHSLLSAHTTLLH